LVFDLGVEDWGDCKGRAWCATCHVNTEIDAPMEGEEAHRLSQLSNRTESSRLACQLSLTEQINNKIITYIGDD